MRVANLKDRFSDLSEVKTITFRREEVRTYALVVGDLVVTEGGGLDTAGRAAVWSGLRNYCAHQNHAFRVRPMGNLVLTDSLRDITANGYGKEYFLSVAKRTTIASINKTQLKGFPVPLPFSNCRDSRSTSPIKFANCFCVRKSPRQALKRCQAP